MLRGRNHRETDVAIAAGGGTSTGRLAAVALAAALVLGPRSPAAAAPTAEAAPAVSDPADEAAPAVSDPADEAAPAVSYPADEAAPAAADPAATPALETPSDAPVDALSRDIARLQSLLAGDLSPDVDVAALVGVDPRNDDAVEAAIRAVRRDMDAWADERERILGEGSAESSDAGEPHPPAGAEPGGGEAGDANPDGVGDTGSAAPSPAVQGRLDELALLERRSALRLAFLTRPHAERVAAVEAVEERRRLAEERDAAAAARREAEQLASEAERERRAALDRAAEARSEATRLLAAERARLEEVRAAIAAQRTRYAELRAARAEADDEMLELSQDLEIALSREDLPAVEADQLYDRVIPLLVTSRRDLRAAMDERKAPSRYPRYEPEIDLSSDAVRAQIEERDELLGAIAALRASREEAVAEEREQRWAAAAALARQVTDLNDYRLALLLHLSPDKRERVLGIGPQGIEQLGREIEHTVLMARWTADQRLHDLGDLPLWVADTLGRSTSRWHVVKLLAILVAAALAYRRRKELMAWVNRTVRDQTEGTRHEVGARRVIASFNAVAVDMGLLLVIWTAAAQVRQLTQIPEVMLANRILLTYAAYRFVLAVMHRFFVSAASLPRRTIGPELSDRIRSSVRLVAYYMFVVGVLLAVAEQVLGRGYLFTMVQQFFWIGAFPIAYVLLRRWRDDIFDTYLRLFPDTRLAEPLRRMRPRWYALLGVVPAVLLLSARATWVYLRNLALRFERTRKGLAYLFRRRLETKTETLGHGTRDVTSLPGDLRESFTAPAGGELLVEHFPGLEEVAAAIREHRDGQPGRAVALVGETGVGKMTWLRRLGEVVSGDGGTTVRRAALDETLDTEAAVCHALSRVFAIEPCDGVDALSDALEGVPRQVVMLDHCQNVVLRAVRGADGLDALARILRRTVHRHVWILSFSRHIWEYLVFAWRGQDVFDRVIKLAGWPEERIRELIDLRVAASGYAVDFEDLLDEEGRAADPELELERTRDRFLRLVWDYTDGIPALALHFWMRSLVVEPGKVARVRLFEAPRPDVLERLQEQSRFVLTAVVTNEDLTLDEAVRVLQYTRDECLSILELLQAQGYLDQIGPRYRVSTDYNRAVVRYLRRKHLLHS